MIKKDLIENALGEGDFVRAALIADKAVQESPRDPELRLLQFNAHMRAGNQGFALVAMSKLVALEPQRRDAALALARGNLLLGRDTGGREAIDEIQEMAAELDQEQRIGVMVELTEAQLRLGHLEEVNENIGLLEEQGLGEAQTSFLKARLMVAKGDLDGAKALLLRLNDDKAVPTAIRLQSMFELSRVLDRRGEYDAAFAVATSANRDPAAGKIAFDREKYATHSRITAAYFDRKRLETSARSDQTSEKPVFIVGMPRTGTTLTEQIISAHSQGCGIGELSEIIGIAQLIARERGGGFPGCLTDIPANLLNFHAENYIGLLDFFSSRATRIANKALGLDRVLGLIQMLLPGARLIFVTRNPLDSLLSTYMHPMQAALFPWARDLEDLAFVRSEYDRLMNHWKAVLKLPIYEFDYDRFVRDQDSVSRELLEFLGMPFEESCISFHQRRRLVSTPSFDQVSRPVTRAAAGRWRNYEKHLGPLLRKFEAAAGA